MSSACFTGHRNLKCDVTELGHRLYDCLEEKIINNGLTDFYAGGAQGFDKLSARTVLQLREKYTQVKLHLILPCSNEEQTEDYSEDEKTEFFRILELADSVEYIGHIKQKDSMKKRNARLVECADTYCFCYFNSNDKRSGTGQTVRMAERKDLNIINLYEFDKL